MPLVSVLIPTFNRPKWLVESINSVLTQDIDLEVLVLDNGSGPETCIALERFKKNPRVRCFRVEFNQPTTAHLYLAERALGEFSVLFTDDDRMLPGNLRKKVEFLQSHPGHGMVFSSAHGIDQYGFRTGPTWLMAQEDILEGAADLLLLNMNVSMPSVVFRSEHLPFLKEVGKFGIIGDWAFFLEINHVQDSAYFVDQLVEIRSHSGQDTNLIGRTGGFYDLYPRVWEHWLRRGVIPTEGAWDAMRRVYLGLALEQHGNDIVVLAECIREFNKLQLIGAENGINSILD